MAAGPGKRWGVGRLFATGAMYFKLMFSRQTPWKVKALLALAVLYLVFPYDFVPDWLLGFGIIDDLAIFSLLTWAALRLLDNENSDRDSGKQG